MKHFLCSNIKYCIQILFDDYKDKNLLEKVSISIIYYRVLGHIEILLIELKDTRVKDAVNNEFPYCTRQRVKGFYFKCLE